MGFARYFDKAALSATSLLRGADHQVVRGVLQGVSVQIRFDAAAAASAEGQRTLELLTNLLARLYPTLCISGPEGEQRTQQWLRRIAQEINPRLEITDDPASAAYTVCIGDPRGEENGVVLYAGSDGWVARTSSSKPLTSGNSQNPFGAGVAACLAAAWVFRSVFADFLPQPGSRADGGASDLEEVAVSALDLSRSDLNPALPEALDVGETFLVGIGAIGNAALWALARTPGLSGMLVLIDGERIELSNVQRYVLTREEDEQREKVMLAANAWDQAAHGGRKTVRLVLQPQHWAEFVAERSDYRFDRVLLALDSAEDRIAVQSSLPRWIVNAWTQPENLGVSRHPRFGGEAPCIACLYLPRGARPNLDEVVADQLGADTPEERALVRMLLYTGGPVGPDFLSRVAVRMGVPVEPLLTFASASLHAFYARAVCGGVLLGLGAQLGPARPAEVPMAFQSALAGLLLAAELVADAGDLRHTALPARTEVDLLRPLSRIALRPHSPAVKDDSGRCLCADETFRDAYEAKYRALLKGSRMSTSQEVNRSPGANLQGINPDTIV